MELTTVTFQDWLKLQTLLKAERLQLESGSRQTDQAEKQQYLAKIKDLHLEYYRTQLGIRQEKDKRELADNSARILGNTFSYVDRMLFNIRTTPSAFALLLKCTSLQNPQLNLLLETIIFSFFEDLVNPENSEVDLLAMLKELVLREVGSSTQCGDMFAESSSSIAGKLLVLFTHRRAPRRFIKLMLKQTLIRIINTDDRTLHLDARKIYREVKEKRRQFYMNTRTGFIQLSNTPSVNQLPNTVTQSDDETDASMSQLDEEVSVIMAQMTETLQRYCLLILDAVYNGLESMPFSMRWLCRVLSNAVLNRTERNTVRDRNITLGTWVFTKWVLVSVQSADVNGLLWDTQITETNVANFGLIGRVIRHIYEEAKFEEEQFESINQFILKEM